MFNRLPDATWIFLVVVAAMVSGANICCAQSDVTADEYLHSIKPLLKSRCYACHGALKQEGEVRLDTRQSMTDASRRPAIVIPFAASSSLLYQRVATSDEAMRMPPEGESLTRTEIELIRRWIEEGAAAPEGEPAEVSPHEHWAFRPIQRPPVSVRTSEPRSPAPKSNAIDVLLASASPSDGAGSVARAQPDVLLRRLYLDLVGVPPTRAEMSTFLRDRSPDAYVRVVDRLLQSPRYGERWGRHWMDVWRYSDWYGRRAVPDVMNSYPMIWRWRDWIVRSLNQDLGYDAMVRAMLAADELTPHDEESLAATGFLVRSWFKWNYETWKKDLVEHTGKAFLGLTLNCAQCHDHKYDPITQQDYFQFRAIFEPLELRHERVEGEPDPGPFAKYIYAKSYGPIASGMIRVQDEYLELPTFMFQKGDSRLRIPGRAPVTAGVPTFLGQDELPIVSQLLPPDVSYPGLRSFVKQEARQKCQEGVTDAELAAQQINEAWAALTPVDRCRLPSTASLFEYGAASADDKLAALDVPRSLRLLWAKRCEASARLSAARAAMESLERRIVADTWRYGLGDSDFHTIDPTSLRRRVEEAVRSERAAAVLHARWQYAQTVLALWRAQETTDTAVSGSAAATPNGAPNKNISAEDMTKLTRECEKAAATWQQAETQVWQPIVDYTPLSPRYPNRTSGRRAALAQWITRPDHPLTARVAVNHLWLRHFGRALVETPHDFGRNGSRPNNPALLDWLATEFIDSGYSMKHLHRVIVTSNAYCAERRHQPQRMDAEVVRDSLLAVADELDLTMGGKEIDIAEGLTSRRRSIYFSHHGEERMEFLELFDAASPLECYRRTPSIQPQQALALSNSELTERLSARLAETLWADAGNAASSAADDSDRAWQFVTMAFQHVLNRNARTEEISISLEFLGRHAERLATNSSDSEAVENEAVCSQRARRAFIHALMNHHDFVTIH